MDKQQEEMTQEEIHTRIREIFLAMTDEQRTKALKVVEEITKREAGE